MSGEEVPTASAESDRTALVNENMSQLDLESESFDPVLALGSANVLLPFPNVKALNNLAEYESMITGKRSKGPKPKVESKLALSTVTRPRRVEKTVLTMMENAKGPLGYLNKCIKDRIMVKVWTRRANEMRGVCKGFVEAFDHHWNLVMSDVDEFCLIPSHLKSLPTAEEGRIIESKKTVINKSKSKFVSHQRHVTQLFIRGDNVALISVAKTTSTNVYTKKP